MRTSYIVACGLVASLETLTPAFALSVQVLPTAGHPANLVTLTGSGFGDSEAVDVYLDTTDTVLTVSSATGTLTASVFIPASEQPGKHFLTAIGRHSGSAAQVAYNVSTQWIEQGLGAGHLSWNAYENTISEANVATLGELWTAPTSTLGSAPAVVNGRVFVTANSGVQALSPVTGAVQWSALAGDEIYGSPAVASNLVYAIGANSPATLYALNVANGTTKWMQTLGAESLSSPIAVNGVVYIACYDKIYALNGTTGAILWSAVIGSTGEAAPAVIDGVVYVGSDETIYALNAATGATIWSYATGGTVEGSPSVVNGVLYEGSDDGKVYALRTKGPSPGTVLWTFTTGSDVYQSPAVAEGVVYIGSQDEHLYALDAHTGATRWSFAAGGIVGSAAVANNIVYATARDGSLYALDATEGTLLATADVGYSFLGGPVVSDGQVYLNTFQGNTYAFGLLGGVNAAKLPATPPRLSSLHPDLSLRVTR